MIECCHVRSGGMGRKADHCFTVGACWIHHDEMDGGKVTFQKCHTLAVEVDGRMQEAADLLEAAALTHEEWLRHDRGLAL